MSVVVAETSENIPSTEHGPAGSIGRTNAQDQTDRGTSKIEEAQET